MARMRYFTSYLLATNWAVSSASSSGWLAGLSSVGSSSTGSMMPAPKKWAHRRLAAVRAEYPLAGDVSHSASACRLSTLSFHTGDLPSGKRASTTLSVPGMAIVRLIGWLVVGTVEFTGLKLLVELLMI